MSGRCLYIYYGPDHYTEIEIGFFANLERPEIVAPPSYLSINSIKGFCICSEFFLDGDGVLKREGTWFRPDGSSY